MDGFWAFCMWTAITCSASFGFGHMLAAQNLTSECDDTKQMVVRDTVFSCEITHKIINGKRIALEK
jgi:hypothetical protein